MDVIFCVRILYIVDSINKIIDHIDDFDLSPLAREWFAGFGKIGGDVIHLVIGLLIGFDNAVSLKECLLLDEANRIVDNYEWMNFPEFGLEIDVQNTDVIFFHPGQHPLENEKVKKCIFVFYMAFRYTSIKYSGLFFGGFYGKYVEVTGWN